MIAKANYGQQLPLELDISFDKLHYLGTDFKHSISNKPCQCQGTADYWLDDNLEG